jgi:hypothetical protein
MKSMLSVCFLIVLLCVPLSTGAEKMHRIANGAVNVQYPAPLRNVAREVTRIYPSVKRELEELFDASIPFTPTITLINDRDDFQRIAGNSPVVALAVSSSNSIIIDNSRMKTHPFTLEVTMKHELSHLVVHHVAGNVRLPRWFHEGIAQWASDGIAEIVVGERRNLLRQAVLSNRLIPLGLLDATFPGDESSLLLAYEQSRSIISFLSSEYGPGAVVRTLNSVGKECDIDCALKKNTGHPLFELEEKWHASLKRNITWFTYASTHLYQILFIFASLVLTAGFFRVLLKKRRYRDEEGDFPPDNGRSA